MKHETVKLNGADVRMYSEAFDTWYVLADVASALQVSTNGISRHVGKGHRHKRPVESGGQSRVMIHVNRRGLLRWAQDGTSRLAMQKRAVVEWLQSADSAHSDLGALQARESFADASTIDPVVEAPEVPHASCGRLPDELKQAVAKATASTTSAQRVAVVPKAKPEISQETFLRCQIAAIDDTLSRFAPDSPNGDAMRGQRKEFNDEMEHLTGERVPLSQPEVSDREVFLSAQIGEIDVMLKDIHPCDPNRHSLEYQQAMAEDELYELRGSGPTPDECAQKADFLRHQIDVIDQTIAGVGRDKATHDSWVARRARLNDELEFLACERVPSPQPVVKTINWRQFWSDEHQGISLRALVEAGLYAQQPHAVRALRDFGIESRPVQETFESGQVGKDHILTLKNAQRFAMRARTAVGVEIADLMIEHHNEYQALLDGDVDAANRLASNIRRAPQGSPTDQIRALLAVSERQDQMAAQLVEVQQQVKELAETRERPQAINEYRPSALAKMAGWQTVGGNAHGEAVSVVAQQWGAEEGVHYRSYRERNPNSDRGGEYVSTLYTEEFKRVFLDELRESVQRGQAYFAILRPMKRAINVYCTEHVTEDAQKST